MDAVLWANLMMLTLNPLQTTFFVSIDSLIYSFPVRNPDPSSWSAMDTLIIASLGGAIILHVCACEYGVGTRIYPPKLTYIAILAYCGSFVLIRYRLSDAEEKEAAAEHPTSSASDTDRKEPRTQQPLPPPSAPSDLHIAKSPTEYVRDVSWDTFMDLRSLVSVHQVQPFAWISGIQRGTHKKDPEASLAEDPVSKLRSMVRMLTRVHTATAIMAVFGFILALLGTLAYFWTGLPRALGIFASACLGASLLVGTAAVL